MKSAPSYENVSGVAEGVGGVPWVIAAPPQVACSNFESLHLSLTGLRRLHPESALPVPSMSEDDQTVDQKVGAVSVHYWLVAVILRYLCRGVQLGRLRVPECNL